MKKTWRWPLAGFVLGGLVGATFLTVNVVGASSPVPAGVTDSSFGEILHTPPLLAHAGEEVELRYDVVCGQPKDEPGGACSPKGSVFVRASGASEFVEQPLEREPDGLLSARGLDRRRRVRLLRRARQRPRRDSDAAGSGRRGPAACLAACDLDDGRPGVGAIRRDSAAVVDRLRAHVGQGEPGARARQRPGAVAGSVRPRSTLLPTAPSSCSTR